MRCCPVVLRLFFSFLRSFLPSPLPPPSSTDTVRRDLCNHAARVEHVARVSLGRGLAKVTENQKALEAEATSLKTATSALQARAVQWTAQYQSFSAALVATLTGLEDVSYQTEAEMHHVVELLSSVADTLRRT